MTTKNKSQALSNEVLSLSNDDIKEESQEFLGGMPLRLFKTNTKNPLIAVFFVFVFPSIMILSYSFADAKPRELFTYETGVAANALGQAFSAIGDDSSIIYYNPALLTRLPSSDEIQGSYWFLPKNSNFISFGYYGGAKDDSGFILTASRYLQNIDMEDDKNGSVSQLKINIGYGEYFEPINLYWGIAIKYYHFDILGSIAGGGGLDAGLAYQFYSSPNGITTIDLGASALNLIRIPATTIEVESLNLTQIPFEFRYGLGFKHLAFPRYSAKANEINFDVISIAVESGVKNKKDFVGIGVQYAFMDTVFLRFGYNDAFAYGGGIKFGDSLELDYTYQAKPEDAHRIGVIYRWGKYYKPKYISNDKDFTDDFQSVYSMAMRVYDRYLRDSIALIDANQLQAAIDLLQRIIPLNPTDNEAVKMLATAKSKLEAKTIDDLLSQSQAYANRGNKQRAFETALQAFLISPQRVVDILYQLYDANDTTIRTIREEEIKKQEQSFDKSLAIADFEQAMLIRDRLNRLHLTRMYRPYNEKIEAAKSAAIENYLIKAQQQINPADKLRYLRAAKNISPNNYEIQEQIEALTTQYQKTHNYKKEEKIFSDKLYYLAAISLANLSNPLRDYEELRRYDALQKHTPLLEQYLETNKIIERLNP